MGTKIKVNISIDTHKKGDRKKNSLHRHQADGLLNEDGG